MISIKQKMKTGLCEFTQVDKRDFFEGNEEETTSQQEGNLYHYSREHYIEYRVYI